MGVQERIVGHDADFFAGREAALKADVLMFFRSTSSELRCDPLCPTHGEFVSTACSNARPVRFILFQSNAKLLEKGFIMSTITFNRPDGKQCTGFYAEPAAGTKAPGMVVIQEWWGMTEQIKGVANRLAAAGYRALIPDLYRGKMSMDAKEAEHLMQGLNFGDAAGQDVRGAVQFLKQSGTKVGVTGFCMGGALTFLAAVHVPEADVAVSWYGIPPLEYIDVSRIKAKIQGHFAKHDAFFPIAQVDALEQKLNDAKVAYEFYRYDAQHAFANETIKDPPIPIQYNSAAADLAWQRTFDFLKRNLQ